jgi:hypothetical protein
MSTPEWAFLVPPEHVDFARIYQELQGRTALECYVYLEQLKKEAPNTFACFGRWAKERNLMTWAKF